MNRISTLLYLAISCLISIATAASALADTVDQRPVKFGTSLPATCWAGDIFFKTNATAGANLNACVALNTWVVQGGNTTIINGGNAAGFLETRTSNSVMTTTIPAGTTNVKFGNLVQSVTSGGSVTLGTSSCSGAGLIWKSISPTGTLQIDANANVNLAFVNASGFAKGSNAAVAVPNGNFPLYRLSCGNNRTDQWDTNPILDLTSVYAQKNVAGGTFIVPTEGVTGTTSLDIDPARIQGTDPKLMTSGIVAPGAGNPLCTSINGGATTGGCPATVAGGSFAGFTEARTSNAVMTTTISAGTTNVKFGTLVQSIGTAGSITLGTSSCSSGGLIWKSVTPSGLLQIDANANVNLGNVNVSGFAKGSNTAVAVPNGNFPLSRLSCGNSGSDQWDASPILDLSAVYSQKNVSGGTFIVPAEGVTGTTSVDIDPARIQGTDPRLGTDDGTGTAGTGLCRDANGGISGTGCSSGSVTEEVRYLISRGIDGEPSMVNADVHAMSGAVALGTGPINAYSFAPTGAPNMVLHHILPHTWTGNIDLKFDWVEQGGASGNVAFNIETVCFGAGASLTAPVYNPVQHPTPQAAALAGILVTTQQLAITTAGCAADKHMLIRITRDNTTSGNDGDAIHSLGVVLTQRHN